jgi:hypothetical protein
MLTELRDILLASERFLNWKPECPTPKDKTPRKAAGGIILDLRTCQSMGERHYTPQELADLWGVSVQTIREIFKDEEGVLKLGSDGTRTRRAYKTLRIPESVAERVHTRLSA